MSPMITDEIQKYVDEVCGLIRNKKVHKSIKDELTSHIEELTLDYMDVGLSEEEAVRKAIEQMGSAAVVGKDLNKVHKAAPDWIVLGLTGTFVSIGLFVLWFIQENNMMSQEYQSNYFSNSVIYLVGGLLIGVVLMRLDYRGLKRYSTHIYIGSIILLIYTLLFGTYSHGVIGWIRIGGIGRITVNSLFIAPYLLVMAMSGIFDNWEWNSKKHFLIGMILAFIPVPLLILGHSSINCTIYIIGVITVMAISGLKLKSIICTLAALGSAFAIFILSQSYRIERFMNMLDPERDSQGYGWIYNQISLLKQEAGFLGRGAQISQNMIPDMHTDFVFAFILYCFGWIAGIVLIALVCTFIIRIGLMGSKIKNAYGKMLVYGFCALISTQFILSVLTNLNVLPVVAVSMPFISYGGSNLVINIISISLISNVFKWRNTPYKTVCR